MKALILAAGFGTRLLPHTSVIPKPLFTLNGIPILQICIEKLIQSGFTDIIINTHHLHHQIEQFIEQYKLNIEKSEIEQNLINKINITTVYEPKILDTGGAIRNVRDFMAKEPFMVINSDIISDIDLKKVWDFHISGDWCATLVLHNYSIYNKVAVNDKQFIKNFSNHHDFPGSASELSINNNGELFAFTGVQVISPEFFDYIYNSSEYNKAAPFRIADFSTEPFSSIALYSCLANQGNLVKAFICNDIVWQDIGTPESYRDIAIKSTVCGSLGLDPLQNIKNIVIDKLTGDGSDRGWFRCKMVDNQALSVIIADHSICHHKDKPQEIDAFINIGNHLFSQGIPVPKIKGFDRFAGLVVLEDLGDVHLQEIINKLYFRDDFIIASDLRITSTDSYKIKSAEKQNVIIEHYKKICSLAIDFSIKGIDGFNDEWTFQTKSYSKEMIIEKECRYFVEAFLQGYLKLDVKFNDFIDEFEFIADNALDGAFEGLMHRDMQSRNIMVKDGQYLFIDFQSARRGPLQYDLASLLIDPYVNLSDDIKEALLHDFVTVTNRENFIKSYRYCSLTRNMQMLGAFANLSINKGKTYFEQYIPVALKNLKNNISFVDVDMVSNLYCCILDISNLITF